MNVYGHEITGSVLHAAESRMRQGLFQAVDIETEVMAGVPRTDGFRYLSMRVADRIIQMHRKAGNIKMVKRPYWRWAK